MRQTSAARLFAFGAVGLLVSAGFHHLWESNGRMLPGVPWAAIVGMMLLSVVLLVLGWPIKRWNDGDRTKEIDPIHAARVAMMAKAAALAGSLLTGWYSGAALYIVLSSGGARLESGLGMLAAAGASAVFMIVGIIVESFCRLPPDDDAGAETA